jgi:hypothetical protein
MSGCREANYACNSHERLLHGRNAFLALLHSECLLQIVPFDCRTRWWYGDRWNSRVTNEMKSSGALGAALRLNSR